MVMAAMADTPRMVIAKRRQTAEMMSLRVLGNKCLPEWHCRCCSPHPVRKRIIP